MSAFGLWLRGMVGSGQGATIGIVIFIIVLVAIFTRCAHAGEPSVDLQFGSSFKGGGAGPVLGLDAHLPTGGAFDVFAGTLLWGATATVPNNWSWETGLHACRWKVCAAIGASYLQRIDAVNGSHTNYFLELSFLLPWKRLESLDVSHLSDAGTTAVNVGRQAVLASVRLQ